MREAIRLLSDRVDEVAQDLLDRHGLVRLYQALQENKELYLTGSLSEEIFDFLEGLIGDKVEIRAKFVLQRPPLTKILEAESVTPQHCDFFAAYLLHETIHDAFARRPGVAYDRFLDEVMTLIPDEDFDDLAMRAEQDALKGEVYQEKSWLQQDKRQRLSHSVEAIKYFQRAVSGGKRNSMIYLSLGHLCAQVAEEAKERNHEEFVRYARNAAQAYVNAQTLDRREYIIWHTTLELSRLLMLVDHPQEALGILERTMVLKDPKLKKAGYQEMARVYGATGDEVGRDTALSIASSL
jgi:hypothetical protein